VEINPDSWVTSPIGEKIEGGTFMTTENLLSVVQSLTLPEQEAVSIY